MFDPNEISPGVRDLVMWLRSLGYDTIDSGDGSNHDAGMGCALPYKHVFVRIPDKETLTWWADRFHSFILAGTEYAHYRVEATYSPGEPAIILLSEVPAV